MDNRTMDQLTDAERADLIKQRCLILEQELARVKHDLEDARNEKTRVFKELSDLKKEYDLLNHMELTITFIGGVSLLFALLFCDYSPNNNFIASVTNPFIFVGILIGISALTLLASYIITMRIPILFSLPAQMYRGKHPIVFSAISTFVFTVLLYSYYFWRISQ